MFLDDEATDEVTGDVTPEVETTEGGMEASAPEVESHDEAPAAEETPAA
jgi:hypothetical protein